MDVSAELSSMNGAQYPTALTSMAGEDTPNNAGDKDGDIVDAGVVSEETLDGGKNRTGYESRAQNIEHVQVSTNKCVNSSIIPFNLDVIVATNVLSKSLELESTTINPTPSSWLPLSSLQ